MVLDLHGWFWICVHGSGFACVVLDLLARYSRIYLLFWESITGGIGYESILGTRHFDIRSQGAEVRMDNEQIDYCGTQDRHTQDRKRIKKILLYIAFWTAPHSPY